MRRHRKSFVYCPGFVLCERRNTPKFHSTDLFQLKDLFHFVMRALLLRRGEELFAKDLQDGRF